jgi:ketosteroid isomerase-like protein
MTDSEFISFAEALDQCWMQGRPQDLAAFLDEDVVFVAPGGEVRKAGIAHAIESYRQFMSQAKVLHFRTHSHQVTHRGDAAVLEYEWEITWVAAGTEHHDKGRDILVLSRRDNGWRVIWRTQIPTSEAAS